MQRLRTASLTSAAPGRLLSTMLHCPMPTQGERHMYKAMALSLCVMKSAACMVSKPSVPPPAPTSLLPATMSNVQRRWLYMFEDWSVR